MSYDHTTSIVSSPDIWLPGEGLKVWKTEEGETKPVSFLISGNVSEIYICLLHCSVPMAIFSPWSKLLPCGSVHGVAETWFFIFVHLA